MFPKTKTKKKSAWVTGFMSPLLKKFDTLPVKAWGGLFFYSDLLNAIRNNGIHIYII